LSALKNDTSCDLGNHSKVIVPPSWIVKLPRKGSFKSSLKCSPNKYKGRKPNAPTTIQECQETIISSEHHHHPSNTPTTLAPDQTDPHHNNNNTEKNTPFCVKPIPCPDVVPILIFLNPKSGGNQENEYRHNIGTWDGFNTKRSIFLSIIVIVVGISLIWSKSCRSIGRMMMML
jgi:hypothetical protein